MTDIYKRASQMSLHFQTPQGLLSVDDLWKIPLQARNVANLDDISKVLNKKLKNDSEDGFSLIDKEKKADPKVQLQFDIVKDIIETRLADQDAKEKEREKAARDQKILGLIAQKRDQQLLDMPLEELEKLLAEGK